MLNLPKRHKVVFKGALEKYGEFMVAGDTVAQCVAIIALQNPALKRDIENGNFRIRQSCDGRSEELSIDDCKETLPRHKQQTIEVIPVILGAGSVSPEWKIVIGVVLIIVGCVLAYWIGPGASPIVSLGISLIVSVGVSLATVGIMELITPKTEEKEDQPKYSLGGPRNLTKQGQPIPLVYGRVGVGTTVISSEMRAPLKGTISNPISSCWDCGWNQHTVGKGDTNWDYWATLFMTELIGEGPIVGLLDGEKSVILDGAPLVGNDEKKLYSRTNVNFYTGHNNPIKDDTATVSQAYSFNNDQILTNSPATLPIVDKEADYVILNLYFPTFTGINKNGNQTRTGVTFQIEITDGEGYSEYVKYYEDVWKWEVVECPPDDNYSPSGGGGDMDGWGGHTAGDGWGDDGADAG